MTLKKGQKYTFQARWKDRWGGATKDLDLHLMGPRRDGGQLELLEESENAQNRGLTHYPRERIRNFTAKADGIHCLMLTAGELADYPEWIQLQVFDGETTQGFQFKHPELLSSINNPAESNNPGLMAIGNSLALIHIALSRESSRGPVPEPTPGDPNRPDVAGASAITGTSFSSARVAGMAALVIDALGDNANYSEPHQIAKYLRDNAAQYTPGQNGFISPHPNDPSTLTNQDPNPHWGHGLAFLPQPEKPKNVTIALVPGTKDQIKILYRNEPWDADLDFSRHQSASINIRATGGTGAVLYQSGRFIHTADESLTIQVRRGATYQATVVRCPYVFSLTCTERSDPSNELYLPGAPQTPTNIQAIPGHQGATIKWHNPGNPGDVGNFEIEELGGPTHTSNTTKAVIRNLENGTAYQFRVRAVLGDEQSGWTTWFPVTPEDSKPGRPTRLAYGNYDTSIFLYWRPGTNADTYQVQQWDGSARGTDGKMGAWRDLPFRQSGRAKQYKIDFLGLGRAARIDNLAPGTAYKYKLRSLNIDRHSQWSEQISISTTGQNPDPNPAPTPIPTPNKTQPEGLTAVISGTDVILTWTRGENPNYVSQVVRRRVANVTPEEWTDVTVGVNDITYTDTTVQSSTEYIYRVHALKNNGVKSELTNPAYATVP